ncbi:glycosyltransferase family 4 protein [Corynebacterium sp. Q4381]|uniref:glycosyltransferase family 4 protein n=1 Tax=Corynebacterium sp. Marseille-Q4381 TaxID=3121597 RepID=UPI002FE5FFA0
MTIKHSLRLVTLTVSAVYRHVSTNASDFLRKFREWARLNVPVGKEVVEKALDVAITVVSHTTHEGHRLLDDGHLAAARQFAADQGDQALVRRIDRIEAGYDQPRYRVVPRVQPAQPTRALYVVNNCLPYTNSGYTVRTQRLLVALRRKGVDVDACTRLNYPVIVGKWPGSDQTTVESVTYHHLLPWVVSSDESAKFEQSVDLLSNLVRELKPSVLHTTTDFHNANVVSTVAERFGLPWVYEVRGELENTWLSKRPSDHREFAQRSEQYRRMREAENDAISKANAVIGLSEVSKNRLVSNGADPDKTFVVPNSIDASILDKRFDVASIRNDLGLGGLKGPLVGTVTSVVSYEGLHTLIEALEYLPSGISVIVVGDGQARPDLEKFAQRNDLAGRVHFVGRKPQADIWKWYAALDVFVLPRVNSDVTRNVTPIKPLTAMALGIPVIASDLPALREVTGGFANYFPPEDAEALAEAIVAALADENQPESENAMNEWLRNRTWDSAAATIDEIYRSFCAGSPYTSNHF